MTHNPAFKTFYEQLSPTQKILFMHDARKICAWSHSTFYYKVRLCNLSPLETAEVIKLARKYDAAESTLLALRRME